MSLNRFALPLGLVATLLAVTASSALAARGHVFDGTIGEPCTAEPCAPGKLKEPSAVAVNETTGDIYVLDQGNDRVQIFNSAGDFLGEFNGSEAPTGPFSFGSEPQVSGIAVDNSCALHEPPLTGSTCKAFDESVGDLYVADTGHEVVDKFSAAGTYLGQITEPFGLAVDNAVSA
jgi:DNA-binding beta-propeller fold protein YncE